MSSSSIVKTWPSTDVSCDTQRSGSRSGIAPLRVVVTGEDHFARRHAFLFEAIAERCRSLEFVTMGRTLALQAAASIIQEAACAVRGIALGAYPMPTRIDDLRRMRRRYLMTRTSYMAKSLRTERLLQRLNYRPDIVLHIFSLFRPFWHATDIPVVHYLDYTAAMLRRNWPPNLAPMSDREFGEWLAVERLTYDRAAHLFTMSEAVASSLTQDYGIDPAAVTVVGSSGQFRDTYEGPKNFGSKQLLFNARPFDRKGGDIALAAFEMVRRAIPDATLVVVGTKLDVVPDGVRNPGFISDPQEMRRLFVGSDLVIAPARADPFPGFLIEAMSHGVPCVASCVDGVPEIVEHQVDGIILERLEPEHLAERIMTLLGDIRRLEAFSRASRLKARERFSWSSIADRIVSRLVVTSARADRSDVKRHGGS